MPLFCILQKVDGVRDSMADFLYTYLTRRFAFSEQVALEWGYNLHDACQRYSHDEHIGLFWGVLENEVCLHMYISQISPTVQDNRPALLIYFRSVQNKTSLFKEMSVFIKCQINSNCLKLF